MKIGVDLRVLQVGHQYRGIGEVAKRVLNGMFELAVAQRNNQHQFVFYQYDNDGDPKEFLTIPKGLQYDTVSLGVQPLHNPNRTLMDKMMHKLRLWYGNPIPQAASCDVFLQFEYSLGVPRHPRTVLVKHDIIPYIFWKDYFTSPWLHVKHKAVRTTIRTLIHNYEYRWVLKRSLQNAWKIICVSDHTRQDLERYFHVPDKKMQVVHLGVAEKALHNTVGKKPANYPTKPFLLFIGAVDARRRRIDDIVAAYNNLKASGHDIQLVLAGENFPSVDGIPNQAVRNAILDSSYRSDILTVGYIDDVTKQRLYHEAIVFVFPTTYEGFGIPVLEAMLMKCPVIVYRNSSVPEVGGMHALYAHDWVTIRQRVEELLALDKKHLGTLLDAAYEHACDFRWEKTAKAVFRSLRS